MPRQANAVWLFALVLMPGIPGLGPGITAISTGGARGMARAGTILSAIAVATGVLEAVAAASGVYSARARRSGEIMSRKSAAFRSAWSRALLLNTTATSWARSAMSSTGSSHSRSSSSQ